MEAYEIPDLDYMHDIISVMSVGKWVFWKINK